MNKHVVQFCGIFSCIIGLLAFQVSAQQSQGRNRPRGGPPQAAINACEGKQQHDTCQFITPRGTITGTCRMTPEQQLACAPKRTPHQGPQQAGRVPSENVSTQQTGIIQHTREAFEGYTLVAPLSDTTTYLLDNDGIVVHSWQSDYFPGNVAYLLDNGHLLRTGAVYRPEQNPFEQGGAGGIVQEFDWDGNLVWEFRYASEEYLLHHDIERLPNGNILMIAWEEKTAAEARASGRNPDLLRQDELWPDTIIEVKPTGQNSGEIVWEWHVWDHLVQDYDASKPNYVTVVDHPELLDLNFTGNRGPAQGRADWNHINSIDYNAELDQIVLSVHTFSEIWIIDHSTTTAEAASHSGGLLYRWGNPQAYQAGNADDQQLFAQHDAHWIENGLPGAGHILIFNNGDQRIRPYSSVDEIIPPVNTEGNYEFDAARIYGPAAPVWSYSASGFFSANISGAQRLPNGNTLICSGANGIIFEVTPNKRVVWEYVNALSQPRKEIFRAYRYDSFEEDS